MKWFFSAYKLFLITIATTTLFACGTAPRILESSKLVDTQQKIKQLSFAYSKSKFQYKHQAWGRRPSYSNRSGLENATGYDDFGQHLANTAPVLFREYKVNTIKSKVLGSDEPISEFINESQPGSYTLLVFADKSRISSNRHSTIVNFVFNALVLENKSRKTIWKTRVDTSTWTGNDFVMKNFESRNYDEKYARQLLRIVADKMKEDQLI